MDLKVGDFVKFLNEVGGGKITKILDDKKVLVEVEDGFEFPYLASELIKIEQDNEPSEYQKVGEKPKNLTEIENQLQAEQTQEIKKDNEDINIYLAIVPQNQLKPSEGQYEIILLNDSNWYLFYVLEFKTELYQSFPGVLQPNYQEVVRILDFENLSKIKEIEIKILMYRNEPHKSEAPLQKRITIKPEKYIEKYSFKENEFFNQRAKIFTIIEKNPLSEAIKNLKKEKVQNIIERKETKHKKRNFKSGKLDDKIEIDLHINALLDDLTNLDKKDMLAYQLEVFENELKKALKNPHIKKIIFIHGKGNGKLRAEIRERLKRRNIKFSDASIAKYGFGATEVFVSKHFYSKYDKKPKELE